jgi:F0F1-type ATP synthase membrane subunit c/vacuolar-type H+-ATPase subunit K
MTVDIEKMRSDLAIEGRRSAIQAIGVGVACFAAGAGAGRVEGSHARKNMTSAARHAAGEQENEPKRDCHTQTQ